jgi:hypothetical protein
MLGMLAIAPSDLLPKEGGVLRGPFERDRAFLDAADGAWDDLNVETRSRMPSERVHQLWVPGADDGSLRSTCGYGFDRNRG